MAIVFSPLMRVVLAMYLALWTPAMCCCAIKSAMGQATCVAAEAKVPDCCAKRPAASCCSDQAPADDSPDSSSKCKCHERSIDKLDTGIKAAFKPFQFAVASLEWNCNYAILAAPEFHAEAVIRSRRAHPPPMTLLDQHRLLLI